MQSFEPHLHWSFQGEHVLFPAIKLDSLGGFSLAAIIVVFICLSERALALVLDEQWCPKPFKFSRIRVALWRTALYALATSFRLLYMLVAMTFHAGLFLVLVASLSAAQLAIELHRLPQPRNNGFSQLRNSSESTTARTSLHSLETTPSSFNSKSKSQHRPPRSKPKEIFIHPTQSNIARADAVALELGIASGDTERVDANGFYHSDASSPTHGWDSGKGRDRARELLGGGGGGGGVKGAHRKSNSFGPRGGAEEEEHFFVNDSDSDLDS